MIPKNISQNDVIKAIREIDSIGIPSDRHSTKWSVQHNDKQYPPKYIVSIANRFANGEEWHPSKFSGGTETNQVLESLGFKIISTGTRQQEYPIVSHSWELFSETVAIKHLDKSAFLHHGTGIPFEIRPFFGLEDFFDEEKRQISLLYKGQQYEAHFQLDPQLKRVRLFWKADFVDLLKNSLPGWFVAFSKGKDVDAEPPIMRFEMTGVDRKYEVALIFPDDIEQDIESEISEEYQPKKEGTVKLYYGKRYERDPANRKKALEIHGVNCVVCGFNFEKVYGERGKGFIEVHHAQPLGSLDEEQIVDPLTDLVPVCANCHRMIHRRKEDILTIEKIKKLACAK